MNTTTESNVWTSFTDVTKKLCFCSFISIMLILLFILSPLNYFVKTSFIMKIIILLILGYTIYLNSLQTEVLRWNERSHDNPNIKGQLNINIYCSYILTLFLVILLFMVLYRIWK